MEYSFRQFTENWSWCSQKKKYESDTNSSASKKVTPILVFLKNYFDSDFTQKHAIPTYDSYSATQA